MFPLWSTSLSNRSSLSWTAVRESRARDAQATGRTPVPEPRPHTRGQGVTLGKLPRRPSAIPRAAVHRVRQPLSPRPSAPSRQPQDDRAALLCRGGSGLLAPALVGSRPFGSQALPSVAFPASPQETPMDLPRVWGSFLCFPWRCPLLGGLAGQPVASGTGASISVYVLCLDPAGQDLSLVTGQAGTRGFHLLLPPFRHPLPLKLPVGSLPARLKSAALVRTRVRILLSLPKTLRKVFPLMLIGNQNRNLCCIQPSAPRDVVPGLSSLMGLRHSRPMKPSGGNADFPPGSALTKPEP